MYKLMQLLKTQGVIGLIRPIKIRVLLCFYWLLSVPLFVGHLVVCCLIAPFVRVRVGAFPSERIGHLALNPELYLRRTRLKAGGGAGGRAELSLFVSGKPANLQLLQMWKRVLRIYQAPLLHAMLRATHRLWLSSPFFEPLSMNSNEFFEFNASGPSLFFTEVEEGRGASELKQLGIDIKQDWFVCVFARDSAYLTTTYPDAGDWSYHDHRDADIDSFDLAINEIVRRGGFVVRMGSHVNKPLHVTSDRVIDYAVVARNDFMDIFLTAKCRFFLGTTSGLADLAMIFDRPRLSVNSVPFGWAPFGKACLFIPKLICDPATGVKYSFGHLLQAFSLRSDRNIWDGHWALTQGYQHLDNTAEEVLDVTVEMLERLDKCYVASPDDEERQHKYRQLIPSGHWSAGIATPIGAKFIKKYQELLVN